MDYPIFIGGQCVSTGHTREIRLPYDGSLFARVHQAGAGEVDQALAAAFAAAPGQRDMPPFERARILRRAAGLLAGQKEDFALAVSSESGKPIRDARLEVDRGIQTLEFSALEAQRLGGEFLPLDTAPAGLGHWAITVREPLGVIAAITPFNFPLNLSLHKIAPAIAAGNTVVHKPASFTPVSALMLARLMASAGLPAGVLNVIPGPGGSLGRQLITDPRTAMVTFTGSPEVGVGIRAEAGLRRVTLELGSNAAVIVAPDADFAEAARRTVTGAFALAGQSCISVQRIYVQEDCFPKFLDLFLSGASRLKLGHPHQEDTDVSSLITEQEAVRVEEWIQEAVGAGARLVTGGARRGAVIEPAVLTRVPSGVRLHDQEVFGPVVLINPYATLADAIVMVNNSAYGLQAGIYTRDIRAAFQAARQVHVGGFWINEIPTYRVDHMPYGGVKLSGTGREGPRYAVEEMTELKLIGWKL